MNMRMTNWLQRRREGSKWSVHRLQLKVRLFGLVALVTMLASCGEAPADTGIPSALDPRGPAAREIEQLWWVMFGLGTAIFVLVIALLLFLLVRGKRRSGSDVIIASRGNQWWIWLGGVVLPVVTLSILLFFTLRANPAYTQLVEQPASVIEVVGHQWWWEVVYPDAGVTTANEIHIPVGQPVELRLTSEDVIHSFWVAQLQGKMDAFPGDVRTLPLQADEPGEFRGECAEFCGIQHAKMAFIVVAEPPEAFASWLEEQSQPAAEPTGEQAERGQELFFSSGCATCHTIRGTRAAGDNGPDLTHLASRRTIGAGTLTNTRGNLAGWVADPQHIKPGNLMPPTSLSSEDLNALLHYLSTLQ